jgi:hypothetical protein
MDMAEQTRSDVTHYRYAVGGLMLAAWCVGILQLFGIRF